MIKLWRHVSESRAVLKEPPKVKTIHPEPDCSHASALAQSSQAACRTQKGWQTNTDLEHCSNEHTRAWAASMDSDSNHRD